MFTKNSKPAPGRPGRPAGRTPQGDATREKLYRASVARIARHGYAATTLRDVAADAGVSVGLLYRYFPSKRAVVIALYDDLSGDYARQAASMPAGRWRDRFLFAMRTSLRVLAPHREALRALIPVMVGDAQDGLFADQSAFSRRRVQQIFEQAVAGATDAPRGIGHAVGRLLYLVHLAVLLWWLLDRSSKQRGTDALVGLMAQILPSASLALRLPAIQRFARSADGLVRESLFDASGLG